MFDKETTKNLRERINKALEPLSEDMDIIIRAGNAKIFDTEIKFELTAKTKDHDMKQIEQRGRLYRASRDPQSVIGEQFDFRGKRYEIIEIRSSNPKYPVFASDIVTKREYKFPVNVLDQIESLKSKENV